MKVLTIKQPYASLITMGYKKLEFRKWKTNYRGTVLIHAGKGIDKMAMKKFENLNLECPNGVIIAKCNLVDCIEITEAVRNELSKLQNPVYEKVIRDTEWKGYGFRLENVEKVGPIEIKGKLGLWNYEDKKTD